MSLKPFLTEGLIKLPPKVIQEATRFFVEKLLAYSSYHSTEIAEDKLEQEIFTTALKRISKKFGAKLPSELEAAKVGRSKITQTNLKLEVPESYITSLKRLHKKNQTAFASTFMLKYIIVLSGSHELLDGNESGAFVEQPPTMLLDLKNLGLSKQDLMSLLQMGRIAELDRRIEYAISTLEHELTHGVQFLMLQQLHPSQVSGSGSKGARASDKVTFDEVYYTSQKEFDPQLKSALKSFENIVRRKGAKTRATKQALLRKFTWDDIPKPNVPEVDLHPHPDRSPFFQSLKRVDPIKWKKALKLFTVRALTESVTPVHDQHRIELFNLDGPIDEEVFLDMMHDGYFMTFGGNNLYTVRGIMQVDAASKNKLLDFCYDTNNHRILAKFEYHRRGDEGAEPYFYLEAVSRNGEIYVKPISKQALDDAKAGSHTIDLHKLMLS